MTRFRKFWSLLAIAIAVIGATSSIVAYRQFQNPSWQRLDDECRRLRDGQNWSELSIASERFSKLYPDRAEPWLFRAEAADGLIDLVAEAEYLGKVPDSDPRSIEALIRKGRLEFEPLNLPWEAQKTCDRILNIDGRVLGAHRQSIYFCMLTFQRAELIRRIRGAIRVRRESPESYVYLAGASWHVLPETYEMNTRWLEASPDDETFQVARAIHVYRAEVKKKPERAAEFADFPEPRELLEKFPHNLELLAYLIDLGITAGDVDDVEKLLANAPQVTADADARFWRARAWISDVHGDTDQAEKQLRKGFEIDPYWRAIHFELSQVYQRNGSVDKAEYFLKLHEASLQLSRLIPELPDPFNPKFLSDLQKLAKMLNDFDVVSALDVRHSGQ